MKKVILFSMMALGYGMSAHGATVSWWTRPTICRADTTKCYSLVEPGADGYVDEWDATSNCNGIKLVCPGALADADDGVPVQVSRTDIMAGRRINSDFDVNELNDDLKCFGVRKTSANGTQVAVNGKYVNVWCDGVLSDPDEKVNGGWIVANGAQPTCATLAANGRIGVLNSNSKCYGSKYYNPDNYFIECGASGLMPERIIVLNGANDYNSSDKVPVDAAAANKLFDSMYSVSQSHRKKYFKE